MPGPTVERWLDIDIDAWTRRVVRRHFAPGTGSPYWLRAAAHLPFDPRDVTRHSELVAFGPFPVDVLRDGDPTDLVPLAVPRPLSGRVWDSGGTTGRPCRVCYTRPMLRHRAVWRAWSFRTEGFVAGRRWLHAAPTGPHLIGQQAWELADLYGSLVAAIDMDPRWIKRLIRAGRLAEANEYTEHLLDQCRDALAGGQVDYLSTTPALLRVLLRRHPDVVAALSGVRLSGTHVTPDMYREFTAAMDGGPCGITYGNTFGNSAGLPPRDGGAVLPYVPNYPHVTTAVVDPADWRRTVPYGRTGQVLLTVLHDDLFLPNILERDQAERYLATGWPCDGTANVRPLVVTRSSPEGLY